MADVPLRRSGARRLLMGVLTGLATGLCAVALESAAFGGNIVPSDINKVVVVIEENHSYSDVIGNQADLIQTPAPYVNSLARAGANFTNASEVIPSPSQPNYLALFSGSDQGITDNNVHPRIDAPNLASELQAVGRTFVGYSESLGFDGNDAEVNGDYVRKHNPMTQFSNITTSGTAEGSSSPVSRVFDAAHFPTTVGTDYSLLPTVSFVVPDEQGDMYDTVLHGDAWLQPNLGAYIAWAQTHNSLLIITWDEGNTSNSPSVPMIFYGPMVVPGDYAEPISNLNVLRTIEDMYGTAHAGAAASSSPITDIWVTPAPE